MKKDINYIRELLKKKEENISDINDKEKIDTLKDLLQDDNIFFKLDLDTAVGILSFLGVPNENIVNLYYEIISIKNYKNDDSQYYDIKL